MMPKSVTKVICIIMAALMLLSVIAVLLQVVAVDEAKFNIVSYTPVTGDSATDYLIPIGIILAAVLVIGICVVLPKMKKKDNS